MVSSGLNINSKLGVLGGGQLGRMLIQSAIDLNLDVSVLDGDPNAPCKDLAKEFVCGSITDYGTVLKFGESCDIITIEIENVNTDALKELQKAGKTVCPQPEVIELIKNKVYQKKFYIENSIPTAPFIEVKNRAEISGKIDFLPAVNKLAREGYDGRGVIVLKSKSALNEAFDAPGLLEKYIDFEKELAVIVARNQSGEIRAFPVVELVFHPEANLVEYLFSPAIIALIPRPRASSAYLTILWGVRCAETMVTSNGTPSSSSSSAASDITGRSDLLPIMIPICGSLMPLFLLLILQISPFLLSFQCSCLKLSRGPFF